MQEKVKILNEAKNIYTLIFIWSCFAAYNDYAAKNKDMMSLVTDFYQLSRFRLYSKAVLVGDFNWRKGEQEKFLNDNSMLKNCDLGKHTHTSESTPDSVS